MNAITKNIPNSITCLNLLSGCFACLFAYKGEYDIVALCIGLSALFDFLDGMAARLLHAYSPMGKELVHSLILSVSGLHRDSWPCISCYTTVSFME